MAAVGLLGMTAVESVWAALPTPVAPSTAPAAGDWIALIKGYIKDGGLVPPDLRSGAVLAVDQVPPAKVYAFAFYIFQQLNPWPEDGAGDYGRAIFSVSPYLTPKYRTDLIANMELKRRQGELAYRVRGMQEIPISATTCPSRKPTASPSCRSPR